jgi:Phage tail sheath C-terminal domain
MATLNSPGVSVSIVNESFYTPAAPGTVPLIFIATAANKQNSSGTGVAAGTTSQYKNQVWTITSQRDLTDTFGTPYFEVDSSNNPVNGGERNEYGLQAAYSVLGVSSKVFVARADVDLGQLVGSSSAPAGAPASGTYWLDTTNTKFGIFEWDASAQSFSVQNLSIIDDSNKAIATVNGDGVTIAPSFGAVGSYAITTDEGNTNEVQYKNQDGNWVHVGSSGETNFATNANVSTFKSTSWVTSYPTVAGVTSNPTFASASGSLIINGTTIAVSTASTAITVAQSINSTLHTSGVGAKVNSSSQLELYVDQYPGTITIGGTASTIAELGWSAKTYYAPSLFIGPHTQYPDFTTRPSGSVYVKTTSPNAGASWIVKQYSGTSQAFTQIAAPIYPDAQTAIYNLDLAGGGTNIAVGTLFVESNFNHGNGTATTSSNFASFADFRVWRRAAVSPTVITSTSQANPPTLPNGATLTIKESVEGSATLTNEVAITLTGTTLSQLVLQINGAGTLQNTSASLNADGTISIIHATGGEIKFKDPGNILQSAGFAPYTFNSSSDTWSGTTNFYAAGTKEVDGYNFKASNWAPLVYTASQATPTSSPTDGTLWYSNVFSQVDIMYHNGQKWQGYKNAFPSSDPAGPIVSVTQPVTQSTGNALANGDIWIQTGDMDQYGQNIYVYNGNLLKWELQDPTDHTSPNGWVFHDARWTTNGYSTTPGTIPQLLASDFVDPDAPDPGLYPRGTRLWNLRRSGYNVKQYKANYININDNNGVNIRTGDPMNGSNSTTPYNPARWVSVSPNNDYGVGTFGRLAQRGFVVKSLKALIDTNDALKDTDTLVFNIMACPGYPEAIQNMVGLNDDRAQTAFVIGDTPFRLPANATAIQAWGSSTTALDNGEAGAVTRDDYTALFYPSGYTNDNLGNYIVVPPSHMMLRTFINSDAVSYQWFAPAGTRRGIVDNASSVGYVDATTGEFMPSALPQGIRDTMALQTVRINPIATLNGSGILNFGNYTRSNSTSAVDRINVSRLVAYLRRQLDIIVRPYLFEPNDQITRNEVKNSVESFLLELVGQRALYDYIVVCDTSNNTPARIDRSELWVDIAVEPVKAVEFIYIPVRLLNTGAIKSGNFGQTAQG